MKKILVIFISLLLILIIFVYQYKKETRILFVGDMFFDRHIRKTIYEKGEDYIFSCIGDFLKKRDLVVGNLEGPITENPSLSLNSEVGSPNNFTFTFPTNTATLLAKNNIKLVNLGNNHINNFGKDGVESTKKYLRGAGINYFGAVNKNKEDFVYRTKVGGQKISFVSYNEFGGLNIEETGSIIEKENKFSDLIIVYAHWGDEYSSPSERIKYAAKIFSQKGASAIIGSHPHVILESEKIGETTVYYSLGNFIFDQYWNKEVSTGLVVELKIKNGIVEFQEYKVSIKKDGRVCLI